MPFDLNLPASLSACRDPWNRIGATYASLSAKIAALPRGRPVPIINVASKTKVTEILTDEYIDHFPNMYWSAIAGMATANGGVGYTQSHMDTSSGTPKFSYATTGILPYCITGYDAWGEEGRAYLCLHECAHTTSFGRASTDNCWHSYQASPKAQPYGVNDPFWCSNEHLANDIALAFAGLLNVKIMGAPTAGFFVPVPDAFPDDALLDPLAHPDAQ